METKMLKRTVLLGLLATSISVVNTVNTPVYANEPIATVFGTTDGTGTTNSNLALTDGGIVNINGANPNSASGKYAHIKGSYANDSTNDVKNGNVTIKNANIDGNGSTTPLYGLYGGQIGDVNSHKNLSGNRITVESTTFNGATNISGALSVSNYGSATGNFTTINDVITSYRLDINGAWVGESANNNTLTIKNSKLTFDPTTVNNERTGVSGGRAGKDTSARTITANNNTTEITNSDVYVPVFGGSNVTGVANENTVTITNSNIGNNNTKNWVIVSGGNSLHNGANSNTVTIKDSVVKGSVAGGQGGTTDTTADSDAHATNGNKVNIINTTIHGNIYGGYSMFDTATNNIVTINNSKINGIIYGGEHHATSTSQIITGNTLNVYGLNNTAYNVKNFETMNFFIPTAASNGDTMLTLNGYNDPTLSTSAANNKTNLSSVKNVNVGLAKDNTKLKVNDTINLLANANGIENFTATVGKIAESDYVEFDSTVALNADSTKLVATIVSRPDPVNSGSGTGGSTTTDPGSGSGSDPISGSDDSNTTDNGGHLTENSKSPVETAAAALNLVNTAGDMITDQVMNNASEAATTVTDNSMAPFVATGVASQRIKSGSYVDTKGWNLNIGFAKEIKNNNGKLLFGPMAEYGHANYDSYLDNGYHASGNNHYFGIGVMAKQTNNNGLYYEGSVRFGKLFSNFEAASATGGKYDSSTKYIGIHAGIGKIVDLNEKSSMDYYAKYFLTHTFGYNTTMTANGREYDMNFGASNSNRIKLGTRYNYKVSNDTTLYTGIAWQYEFSSDNTCTIDGASTPSPSMKGHTGYLEFGIKNTPNNKFECGFGITGSIGKSRGIGANVSLLWKF